ncbi:MAG TPA: GatB/YqeY domain-containing protein [Kofleriaceae bacterium]|nr:GatB/YqeY domain-containing protein [Kofleriaceae bacterium]
MADTVETQLRQQLTAAMKAKDSRKADLIRMINTKIMEKRTAPGFTGQVDDALILGVIRSYKKNMESARGEYVAFGDKGKEQVEQIDYELAWCATMLPAGVDEGELRTAIATAIAGLPAKDPKMAGKIIGQIKKQYGDKADGAVVKRLVDEAFAAK